MNRAVRIIAQLIDALRRGVRRPAAAMGRRIDGGPGWLRHLLTLAGCVVGAAGTVGGGLLLAGLLARLTDTPSPPTRLVGVAAALQLAAGGAAAIAVLTGPQARWRPRLSARGRRLLAAGVVTLTVLLILVLVVAGHAVAAPPAPAPAPPPGVTDLNQVITNMRNWLMGILAGAATLFASIGGLRYMGANGDPGEIERAKGAFKAAGIGYAAAILAPVALTALRSVVGG
ncbi:conserved membrane hypothetical protein [Frankia canadensis]|uniref:Uncharacterized protein n=1 Tax=Frankia canadensis TaxID=1836972 RepID=A0A2I2KRQ1_9ACTN|nr:pilin [Frankia canadensis]SNQ48316.1 conserved membrane hypothetical protein [Frankia canadensis]SOU55606.1 conserved membrane hypothetical protein [Frankia canadensis]